MVTKIYSELFISLLANLHYQMTKKKKKGNNIKKNEKNSKMKERK